jgi:hypothetical protein
MKVIIFHLSKQYPPLTPVHPYLHCAETLYEQIKKGKKTSEWRDFNKYWLYRLCKPTNPNVLILFINDNGTEPQNITPWLKVHKVWFVQGYPKDTLPRLEADITALLFHSKSTQLEIQFTNVKETTK